MIEIDGEKIEEVDACSLHPRIVGKVFEQLSGLKRPDFLLGDVHTNLSKILGVDRKQAKLINLSYWNSKISFDKDLKRYVKISSKANKINPTPQNGRYHIINKPLPQYPLSHQNSFRNSILHHHHNDVRVNYNRNLYSILSSRRNGD
jgi:hypothetical protein